MKSIKIFFIIMISQLGLGQDDSNVIKTVSISHSTNYFTTGASFNTMQIESVLKNEWIISGQHTRTDIESDLGGTIAKQFKTKKAVWTPKIGLTQGNILPSFQGGLRMAHKTSEDLTIISGFSYLNRNDLDNLALVDIGFSKRLKKSALITRVFNSGTSTNAFNPSSSIALLNENENRLIQVSLSGGQQTIIGLDNYEKGFQNFIGGGIWYKKPISKTMTLSVTSDYQHTFSQQLDSFGMVYINGNINFNF